MEKPLKAELPVTRGSNPRGPILNASGWMILWM